jgi:hypothetical protein
MAGRNIIYYQTIQDDYSKYLGDSPFTHIYLASIHVHDHLTLYLNDWLPEDQRYQTLWTQWVPQWIAAKKSVMLLVGGWGNGTTWQTIKKNLDDTPPSQEPVIIQRLLELVQEHALAGIDLDIEQYDDPIVPLAEEFISRIKQYADITITMSPTPDQLADVDTILADKQDALAWANVQMYCGIGVPPRDLARYYVDYLKKYTHLDRSRLVAAVDLDSDCCGSRTDLCTYVGQIQKLAAGYPDFGGTAMWEYDYVFSNEHAKQWPECSAQALDGKTCQYCQGN